jgi:hypothetical protein
MRRSRINPDAAPGLGATPDNAVVNSGREDPWELTPSVAARIAFMSAG